MFILASCSPRRKQLLSKIIPDFQVVSSSVDEDKLISNNYPALEIPQFLATQKALDVYREHQDDIVIAADTAIIYDNKIYGKPKDKQDAKHMLKTFSNNTHFVVTGVCIISNKCNISFSSINEVTFYDVDDKEIDEYLCFDEYKDKAGSYAIQGKASVFIKKINGDYNSIVGLPIGEINRILKKYF